MAALHPTSPARNAKAEALHRSKTGAFNEALDFCRVGLSSMGEDMINDVRSELQNTSMHIKSEVAEILDERQRKIDSKMDAIIHKVQHLSMSIESENVKRSASPAPGGKTFDQAEANRKLVLRREEQIGQITETLHAVGEQLEKVQKKSEVDEMARALTVAMDLPKLMEMQLMGFFQKFQVMQQDQKLQSADVTATLDEVKKRLDEALNVDFTPVMQEVNRCQNMMNEDFQLLVAEIARIQQGLHLDYAQPVYLQPETALVDPVDDTTKNETTKSEIFDKTASSQDTVASKRTYSRLKRVREFWSQTEKNHHDTWMQTDPEMQKKDKKKGMGMSRRKQKLGGGSRGTTTLADADAMKEKARKALMQPQYDVFDYYHEEGVCQAIAKSPWFDNATIAMVCLNAIWIAIEIDYNSASFLLDADLFFIVVENTFCTYFFLEVCLRFGAFSKKKFALRDFWFVFDFVLVSNMVIETWILPVVMVSLGLSSSNFNIDLSVLRMLRMVKLLRLSRIARILRSIPELVIIVKAIGFAARSVAVFFLLWLVIIYLFAVVMTQLTNANSDTSLATKYFPNVPTAMASLLLDGILADYAPFIHEMGINPLWWLLMLFFVLLASVTIMYMLVGVLVEVVGVIAAAEKEGMTVSFVATKLREKMIQMNHNPEGNISKSMVQDLLVEPDIVQMLMAVNVDLVVLMDSLDMLYEDLGKQGGLMTFEKMVELVLNGRGGNYATVRDTKELLRMIKAAVKSSSNDIEKKLSEEFGHIAAGLNMLREEALERDGHEEGDPETEGEAEVEEGGDGEDEEENTDTLQLNRNPRTVQLLQ